MNIPGFQPREQKDQKDQKGPKVLGERGGMSRGFDIDLPSLSTMSSRDTTLQVDEKPPDRIDAVYTDDYNIINVHNIILTRFRYGRSGRIVDLGIQARLEKEKLKHPQTVVERMSTLENIKRLENEITVLTTNSDVETYLAEVTGLVEAYKAIGTITKVVSFKHGAKQNKGDLPEDFDRYEHRHALIANFLEIARKYISINIIHDIPFDNTCPNCNADFKDVPVDEESGVQVCACGYEKSCLTRTNVFTELTRQSSGRNGYDDRDNFLKALRRYEGKQPNHLPENLPEVLDRHFTSFGLPSIEEIRKRPLIEKGPRQGTKEGTSRDMMFKALYETNNVAYYEDINLIAHLTWGWSLPDISYLEEQIMDDYDKTQRIYEALPKERKSNLNIQYRLFKHLQMRKHNCYIDDFKIVKTRDILEYHDSIWRLMIEGACEAYPDDGFVFIDTI